MGEGCKHALLTAGWLVFIACDSALIRSIASYNSCSFRTSCSGCWLISRSCTRDLLTLQQDGFDSIAELWYILVA